MTQPRWLCAFDFDSTLIQSEGIELVAKLLGVETEVSALTKKAMLGSVPFRESFLERVKFLKGLTTDQVKTAVAQQRWTTGALELLDWIVSQNGLPVILSGGLDFLLTPFVQGSVIEQWMCNKIEFRHGVATGEVIPPIIDAQAKADWLERLCQMHGIPLHLTAAVGDGANDIPMLMKANAGIAFYGKPKVLEKAKYSVSANPKMPNLMECQPILVEFLKQTQGLTAKEKT